MKPVRRIYAPGACYFFTLVTYHRKPLLCSHQNITRLKKSIQIVMKKYPFHMPAVVVLPDHLHCIWHLPENDDNFSTRWRLIKHYFSIGTPASTNNRHEKQIWQPRFWDHIIRNENDWQRHVDYIHYNPVKHGVARKPFDWPHSSFRRYVAEGYYDMSWGDHAVKHIEDMEYE